MTSTSNITKGLSLRKNFSWNLVGNIVYAGCQWGMLVVLAKLTSPEMVGRFALGLAVTAPIIMLSNLQLRAVQATDARGEYAFGHYLGLRLLTTAAALVIIASVVVISGYPVDTATIIMAVGISKAFESISDVYYGFMQRNERMDHIARSRIIKGPLSLASLSIIVFFTGDVFWGVMGFALVWAMILICYDLPKSMTIFRGNLHELNLDEPASHAMKPIFKIEPIIQLTWLALPLGIVMALNSLTTNIPRYFVQSYLGEYELGIFSALAYLIIAGNTVINAMGQSVSPRLAKYYASQQYIRFRRLLFRLLFIGVLIGGIGILLAFFVGELLLSLLYGPQYALQNEVFIWVMFAGAASYLAALLGYATTAARYFRIQLPIRIIVLGVMALGCFLMVPSWGAKGAAASMVIALSLKSIFSAVVVGFALKN